MRPTIAHLLLLQLVGCQLTWAAQFFLQPPSGQPQLVLDQANGQTLAATGHDFQAASDNQVGASNGLNMGPSPPLPPPPAHRSAQEEQNIVFRFNSQVINSTTIKLIWNVLAKYQVDSFDLEWGPYPDAMTLFNIKNLNGTSRDLILHDLEPDKVYHFKLSSYRMGQPLNPRMTIARTYQTNYVVESPSKLVNKDIMPLRVIAEARSNSSILLTWTEQERPTAYKYSTKMNTIRLCAVPPAGSLADQVKYQYMNYTKNDSRMLIQNLKPASEYAFAVKTIYLTPDGKRIYTQSGYSMDTIAKTFDLEPSAPRNFSVQELPASKDELAKGSQSIELTWLPPDSPNGQLNGYMILYAHELATPDDKWKNITVEGASTNNWRLAKFTPGSNYYFKMRAINQRGPGADSETRQYAAPSPLVSAAPQNSQLPLNNVFLLIVICMVAILFLLFVVVSHLACKTRRRPKKNQKSSANQNSAGTTLTDPSTAKMNGFASVPNNINKANSTVAARVGTLARRRDQTNSKPDFWISAMDQQQAEVKSNLSEKSNNELNMAMVSIQRDSPQFATTQLATALPDYRFKNNSGASIQQQQADQQVILQQLQQGHYHPGHFAGALAYDQMDSATASALMTLTKRQQQQMQKYQYQLSNGNSAVPVSLAGHGGQAPSPHQQPPPPPPLNIDQQQHQQQQSLYGTHLASTRSLRLHRPTLYDPVSGSFVQSTASENDPPTYNASNAHHHHHGTTNFNPGPPLTSVASNTLQFHPHQTSTLLSRRSTNTLRSFHNTGATIYGQLAGPGSNNNANLSQFVAPPSPSSFGTQQSQVVLQSHQAVINQLNDSTYPSLPLKHVSAVRPQIMSSLEDQIELELAEKEPLKQLQQQQQNQQLHQQSSILSEDQSRQIIKQQ